MGSNPTSSAKCGMFLCLKSKFFLPTRHQSRQKIVIDFNRSARSSVRKAPCGRPDEAQLTEEITALAKELGRYELPGKVLRSKIPRGDTAWSSLLRKWSQCDCQLPTDRAESA